MQCRVEWSGGHSGILVTCCRSSCRESIGVYFFSRGTEGESRETLRCQCERTRTTKKVWTRRFMFVTFLVDKKGASKSTTGVCMSHTRVAHRQTTHTPVLHAVFFKPRVVDLWSSETSHIDKISQILIFTIEIKNKPLLFLILKYPLLYLYILTFFPLSFFTAFLF